MGVDGAAPERCACVCACACVCEYVGGPAFCRVHVLNVCVMCRYLV